VAVLPDGQQVEDRTSSLDPGGGDPAPLVWRTEGAKLQRSTLPKIAALVAVLFGIIGFYIGRLMDADLATTGIVALVAFLVSFAALYVALGTLMRAQLSGEGGLSIMYLPPHLANPQTVGSMVSAAATALGHVANPPKKLRAITYWDLEVPIRFYFNPMMGPARTFMSIKTATREQQDLYRRLKGHVLTQLQPPQPPPPPQPPA
jgi:hypothetical protein